MRVLRSLARRSRRLSANGGPRRSPAKRVRWGEDCARRRVSERNRRTTAALGAEMPQRSERDRVLAHGRGMRSLCRRCHASKPPRRPLSPATTPKPGAAPAAPGLLASATAHCSPLRGLLLGPAPLCCSPSARFAVRLLPASQSLLCCHASPAHDAVLSRSVCTSRPAGPSALRSVCSAARLSPLFATAQRFWAVTLRLCATRGFPSTRAGVQAASRPSPRPRSGPSPLRMTAQRFLFVSRETSIPIPLSPGFFPSFLGENG